ncbi:MAG: hypothetical protein D6714_02725 [Bacteroidetes bacterium]|nr:MAG: hypothetical protein D6714_02725 [Bacteroidota bacterium]
MHSEEYYLKKARRRVKAKKGFYVHLGTFVVTNAFLILINLLTSRHVWFIFPLLSWALAIGMHYIGVFGIPGIGNLSEEWEEKELEKELRKVSKNAKTLRPPRSSDEEMLDLNAPVKEKLTRKNYDDSELV